MTSLGGEDFIGYIKGQLQRTKLLIPLVTPAYLDSKFCMWELGAAWANGTKIVPLVVPPVRFADLDGPLVTRHGFTPDKRGLNGLAKAVAKAVSADLDPQLWEAPRDALLEALPSMIKRLEVGWRQSPGGRLRRNSGFAEAMPHLHSAAAALRDAALVRIRRDRQEGQLGEFLVQIFQFLNAVASAFEAVTGTPCRVTLKQVVIDDGPLSVQDLSRSGGGRIRRGRDLVEENTDFEVLVKGDADWFLCNDLPTRWRAGQYKNSHWQATPGFEPPYRSTLVLPVDKAFDAPLDVAFDGQELGELDAASSLLGFLCIDTRGTDAFDEATDVALGAALADSLYHVLRPYLTYQGSSTTSV